MILPSSACFGDARLASDAGARARVMRKIVQTNAKRGNFNFIQGGMDFLLSPLGNLLQNISLKDTKGEWRNSRQRARKKQEVAHATCKSSSASLAPQAEHCISDVSPEENCL